MEDVLKESAEARKQAVSLRHLEYGGHLVDQLFAHSQQMEKIYGAMQLLVGQPDVKEGRCNKMIDLVGEKRAWFAKAKAHRLINRLF